MRSQDFYLNIAVPNYAESQANKADIRKAYNAALAMFSLHEWILHDDAQLAVINKRFAIDLPAIRPENRIGELRKLINKETHDAFDLITDIALGYKHFKVRNRKRIADGLTKIEVGKFEWEDDHWWSEGGTDGDQIVIMVTAHEKRGFSATLNHVADFYRRLFS